ncbi:MAG: Npun_F0813 family protein [Cuspidothrix sp.]
MFILKRQDVEISMIQHPKKEDQQLPILNYQGQTFRLIRVFKASEEEAKTFWRSLTDNRGKACVLLEEPERYTIWGKVKLDQIGTDTGNHSKTDVLTLGAITLLQAVYLDIEDLLGNRQAGLFTKDITGILQQKQFPDISSADTVKSFLTEDLSHLVKMPAWQETHIILLLEELYKLGKTYFGDTNFAHQLDERLQDMPEEEQELFISWLKKSPLNKLWH